MALDLSKINPALLKAKNVATEQYVESYTDSALQNVNVQEDIDANNNAFAQSLGYPSYSAMQAAASQGNTIINGGLIRTNLIEVENLSAISSNLGTVTAGTINGVAFNGGSLNINNLFTVNSNGQARMRSATSGARLDIQHDRIRVFDASGRLRVVIGRLD